MCRQILKILVKSLLEMYLIYFGGYMAEGPKSTFWANRVKCARLFLRACLLIWQNVLSDYDFNFLKNHISGI